MEECYPQLGKYNNNRKGQKFSGCAITYFFKISHNYYNIQNYVVDYKLGFEVFFYQRKIFKNCTVELGKEHFIIAWLILCVRMQLYASLKLTSKRIYF